jgi:protein-disulfide isomerase
MSVAENKARKNRRSANTGTSLKKVYLLLAAVLVVGIAWIGISVVNRGGAVATAPVPLTGMDDMKTLLQQAQGVTNGNPEATTQVLIFSDFTCPACKQFAQGVEPSLRTEFIDPGKVRFVYYDFPLGGATQQHKWGFVGARAARCAGEQGKYWEYHDVLFARQIEWSYQKDAPVREFVEYARLVAADPGAFEACLRSDKFAEVVTANRELGVQLGVGSTPTVFVGGRPVAGWNDYDEVKAAVLRELGAEPAK